MADSDDAIFREVDDDVRQDEYKKLWTRYGKYFTTIAVVAVAGVAALQGWKFYQVRLAEDSAVIYLDALKKAADGKADDALAALAAVKHEGFGQLAKLQQAKIIAEKGDTEKAVAAYDAIAADATTDPALADLARIKAAYLLVDTKTPDELLARLSRYDKDGAVWRNEAREVFGLAAWRIKDYAMADRYMNAVFTDKDAPASMRQRAQIMIQLITPKMPKK